MTGINLGRDTTMIRQVTYVIFWNEIKSEIFLNNIHAWTCHLGRFRDFRPI